MLDKAIAIAIRAQAGQVDKAGVPYIFPSFRVMMAGNSEIERMYRVLHDTIEDSDVTFEDRRQKAFRMRFLRFWTNKTYRRKLIKL